MTSAPLPDGSYSKPNSDARRDNPDNGDAEADNAGDD